MDGRSCFALYRLSSVGRGTDRPFERLDAPWIGMAEFAAYMNRRSVPGVRFVPEQFTPDAGLYTGEPCQGVRLIVTRRNALESMLMGMEIASALAKLYPGKLDVARMIELVGNGATIQMLGNAEAPSTIVAGWKNGLQAFQKMRAKYLLYR